MAKVPVLPKVEAIPFRKHVIEAALVDGVPRVSLRALCDNLGLDYSSQHKRINRTKALKSTMVITTIVALDGKKRETTTLTIRGVAVWLAGLETSRIKDDRRRRMVERYQEEVADVLEAHFDLKIRTMLNHGHHDHGSVGPAYHDFQPPRTAPGEVEVYSPPATMADLVAFGVQFKEAYTAELAKNMPEILKHAMEHGGKRSFMSQWREKTRAYIAETVAEDVSQVDDQLDEMGETIEQVRDRLIELESAHKRLAKKIGADKGLSNKAKRQMNERLEQIEEDIASLKRVVAPVKKKKTVKSKKRTLN